MLNTNVQNICIEAEYQDYLYKTFGSFEMRLFGRTNIKERENAVFDGSKKELFNRYNGQAKTFLW